MVRILSVAALGTVACTASPVDAQELFGGIYAHDVETRLNLSGNVEQGVDLQLGWRGARIRGLRPLGSPSPYGFVSLNSAGDTHFAAAGLSWKVGKRIYLRPGIGLAVHSGPRRPGPDRIDFGSRILFAPEFGIGFRLGPRTSAEASWVHLSHATLLGDQNPGIDTIGVRINHRFR
ncbi:acyloxyacyl hydrolase [Allosphingosinicella deserti]|uniref:Acyloxyacyl hydrolase n=1 Tax=Allosphingosinicella deserti TaxID=2116704 RepID=A0A2P7QVK2_9SPHN|nr:acyloxyacyl hydrolase [Sphingomonas deserti]PSJ41989.1 acyloxyacyl hydrolase [Sphingomonas deserti]